MRVPAFTDKGNGYSLTIPPCNSNGGGSYVNQYTLIVDVLLLASINWMPFFNSDPANANDADFYVSDNGALGIGLLGYSTNGTIQPELVSRRVCGESRHRKSDVLSEWRSRFHPLGGSLLDGRHALYADRDAGPDIRLFNEGDTSGDYTHEVLVNSLFFTDRTMTADEIKALGGPTAAGISPPAASALRISVSLQGANLTLSWPGGPGIRLQKTASLTNPNWQDVPGTLGASSAVEPVSGQAAFYRLSAP